jgi:hypothetical protein
MQSSPLNSALLIVAIFQIISGIYGIIWAMANIIWIVDDIIGLTLAGIYSMVICIAGILLWLRQKHAVMLSILIQMAQVPFIQVDGFTLKLAVGFSFTISATWLGQNGEAALILGFNAVALAVLIILFIYRPTLKAKAVSRVE